MGERRKLLNGVHNFQTYLLSIRKNWLGHLSCLLQTENILNLAEAAELKRSSNIYIIDYSVYSVWK